MIEAERKLQLIEGDSPERFLTQVAFATADQESVDQHFGSCRSLMIYGIDSDRAALQQVVQFKHLQPGHDQGKLEARFDALKSCCAVYCIACGPSVISQLRAQGVQALKVAEGTAIHELITDLQQQIQQGATGWLARAIRSAQPEQESTSRLASMLDEEW